MSINDKNSLFSRYLSKLMSRSTGLVLGLLTVGLVPRALGPELYGAFNYLTAFFNQVTKFLNMGTSTAFYTKLSGRPQEKSLIVFYIYYILLMATLITGGCMLLIHFQLSQIIWPDQKISLIFAAVLFSMLLFSRSIMQQINDAFGFTVNYEMFYIFQSILSTTCILALFFLNYLTISNYFILHYSLMTFMLISGWRILKKNNINLIEHIKIPYIKFKSYTKEFYDYSYPLFIRSIIVFFAAVSDRWFLQYYSGDKEQGFYGLAYKIAALSFIFTASMSSLFIREMSLFHKNNEPEKMRAYFNKFVPLYYSISAFLAIFIAINARTIQRIIGGEQYSGAALTICIMAFYPIHQTYGQLTGGFFLALERTKILRNVSILFQIAGTLLAFLLISNIKIGLNLGSVGLSIKMITIQFLIANFLLFRAVKILNLSFSKFIYHQLIAALIFTVYGIVSNIISHNLTHAGYIPVFLVSGIIYTGLCIITIFSTPRLFFLRRKEIYSLIKKMAFFSKKRKIL